MVPTLAQGELLWITDAAKLYIGDGTTASSTLTPVTGFTAEDAQDAAASLFTTSPTHAGISFAYDDLAAKLTATVDLSDYTGTIKASAFKGTFVADDSSILVDGVAGVLKGTLVGSLTGNVTGNITGNVIGNVTGDITGNTTGYHTGDVKGSVFADDSTILVDAVDGVLRGNLIGNLTGSMNGDIATGAILLNTTLAEGGPLDPNRGMLIITEGSLSDDYDLFSIESFHTDAASPAGAAFTRGRGTSTSPAVAATDDPLFGFIFSAVGAGLTGKLSSSIIASLDGALLSGDTIAPGKIEISTTDAAGALVVGLSIDKEQLVGFSSSNVVTANSGSGTADVTAGVATYLKIKVGSTEYAIPLYGLVP
jgi:hypothetical protein